MQAQTAFQAAMAKAARLEQGERGPYTQVLIERGATRQLVAWQDFKDKYEPIGFTLVAPPDTAPTAVGTTAGLMQRDSDPGTIMLNEEAEAVPAVRPDEIPLVPEPSEDTGENEPEPAQASE